MIALLAFGPAVLGTFLLALSMSKHYRDLLGRPPSGTMPLVFRMAGWTLIVTSLGVAIVIEGSAVGAVLWIGLLMVAAQLVALMLTCRDRWRAI
ncbi:DUF3325 domain-containing protein [Sphingobium sp. WCS2017Hpa-17]|uniref:DUF3325 domain-containing protein n=1 Tax=Sphingobium sp. WCS2017Hpa-17 TaxID=3073638 RepID=UPI003867A479